MPIRFSSIHGFLGVSLLAAQACGGGGDSVAPAPTGTVQVMTVTTGDAPDPDGYAVQLDAAAPQPIASSASLELADIPAATHMVQLSGVAPNCTVSGENPRTVAVTSGETATVTFEVSCSAVTTTGSLEVTSSTTGSSTDPDGYTLLLDAADAGSVAASAAVTLTGVIPGAHTLGLSGVAANCQVMGDNPRPVVISAGATTPLAFQITCAAAPAETGTLRVTTATTGPDQDPDGYTVKVDGGTAQPVGTKSVLTIASLGVGQHSLLLSGVAGNCTVAGSNPQGVMIAAGATADLSFAIECATSLTGTPSASKSRIAASPAVMNLQGTSVVTVTVRDGNGAALKGVPVTLSATGSGNTIDPALVPSDATGKASFTFSSTVAEVKTITARAGSVPLSEQASVTVEKVTSSVRITSHSPDPSRVNQLVRVTVFVEAGNQSPTGNVTVTVSGGNESCSVLIQNQNGFCDLLLLAPGTGAQNQRLITATYSGDANCSSASVTEAHRVDPSAFEIVSVRDHIPGSFTGQRALFADRDHIYLGSSQGTLFVLARDRAADFPVVQTIDLSVPITGIRGDADHLYVTASDGVLRIFAKGASLTLEKSQAVSTYLGAIELLGDQIYVAVGQAELAVDQSHLFLAQLNEGEVALELDKATLEVTRTYGETFLEHATRVFDRLNGTVLATIPYPTQMLGSFARPVLYLDGNRLVETVAGCCGEGVTIVEGSDFSQSHFIPVPNVNAVNALSNGFLAGTETGEVALFDDQDQLVEKLNLRILTGHTGGEDIEIRAIWKDTVDDLVFAASTWGNDASRSLSLPSFFVLRLK